MSSVEARESVSISSLTAFEVGVGLRGDAQRYKPKFDRVTDEIEEVPFGPRAVQRALEIQLDILPALKGGVLALKHP